MALIRSCLQFLMVTNCVSALESFKVTDLHFITEEKVHELGWWFLYTTDIRPIKEDFKMIWIPHFVLIGCFMYCDLGGCSFIRSSCSLMPVKGWLEEIVYKCACYALGNCSLWLPTDVIGETYKHIDCIKLTIKCCRKQRYGIKASLKKKVGSWDWLLKTVWRLSDTVC